MLSLRTISRRRMDSLEDEGDSFRGVRDHNHKIIVILIAGEARNRILFLIRGKISSLVNSLIASAKGWRMP